MGKTIEQSLAFRILQTSWHEYIRIFTQLHKFIFPQVNFMVMRNYILHSDQSNFHQHNGFPQVWFASSLKFVLIFSSHYRSSKVISQCHFQNQGILLCYWWTNEWILLNFYKEFHVSNECLLSRTTKIFKNLQWKKNPMFSTAGIFNKNIIQLWPYLLYVHVSRNKEHEIAFYLHF